MFVDELVAACLVDAPAVVCFGTEADVRLGYAARREPRQQFLELGGGGAVIQEERQHPPLPHRLQGIADLLPLTFRDSKQRLAGRVEIPFQSIRGLGLEATPQRDDAGAERAPSRPPWPRPEPRRRRWPR
ncbi:hypothetical protein ACIBCB_30030 [Streptomyces uncialis]|uniref:hypothetical protein n=1 Tax=Streptomyces uncialis TaxID=1048205 RepID=UPI0037AAF1C6